MSFFNIAFSFDPWDELKLPSECQRAGAGRRSAICGALTPRECGIAENIFGRKYFWSGELPAVPACVREPRH
jgi:hypothetical protein